MNRLKEKWGIKSNFQFIIILIVFSVTGTLAVWVVKPILELVGLDKSAVNPWIFWPIRIAIIFPIYQVMIVVIGALFGQFKFFWAFEKKMLSRLGFKKYINNEKINNETLSDIIREYVIVVWFFLGFSYFETFYIKYGEKNSDKIETLNRVYKEIGDSRRIVEVSMGTKIQYFFILFFTAIIISLIISLIIWLINRKKNFSKIFRKVTILIIFLFSSISYYYVKINE
jgi:hypothetical protein